MFTAVAHKKLDSAEGYFVEHLSQNDYYAAGEIRPGQWIGVGAERLGLSLGQAVSREQFCALCENRHPQTDERLTRRQNAKDQRRVFFDFTCSAPKSVSVLAVTLDDQRLVDAHEQSARIAFAELETFAATRVRKHGSQRDRTTSNLVAASFTHTTSRALDPQLHTHFTVFNATFDGAEGRWKALQAGGMYEAIRYGTAVYRNELARRVQQIGYRLTPAKHGFEVAGVNDEVMSRFSKRSQEAKKIVQEMEEKLGRKLSNSEVAYAVHRSRARKLKGISTVEVRERQQAQLSTDELQSLKMLCASVQPSKAILSDSDQEAVTYAVGHVFERQSVVSEHELLAAALSHRQGEVDLQQVKRAVRQSPELVPTERGLSTRQILETELSLIQAVDRGRDAVVPLHPEYQPAAWLGDDQRRAVLHVLNTGDRIAGLRGLAGTGKTTALHELANACATAGVELLFCAPTAAATDVLRKEGFDAVTLQSLLLSKRSLSNRNLIVLDEAGAVGIDDMKWLFDLAKDCRLVLSGDTGQHASVARGDALRILEQHSGLESGQLTRIRRQRRAEYRRAVELAAQKRTADAFAQLERMGAVTELGGGELHAVAAQAYLEAAEKRQSALLVAPTWVEIEAVTERIRAALKLSAKLIGEEKEIQVFDSLSWTEAQKRDARQYRPGVALRFHRSKAGFTRGESVEVVTTGTDALGVRRRDGSTAEFKLSRGSGAFDAGESRTLRVAAGDKLLLQANASLTGRRFINGELVEVKAFQGGDILLTDGRVIPEYYRTFTHGYAVTSHAAQGKTVDEVFVVASSRSLPAVHQQQFYVSISRGRERCQVFTDDKDLLRSHVTNSSERLAAVEIVPHVHRQNFIRRVMQRGHRFLKHFRQRMTQFHSLRKGVEQIRESSYEHQHKPRRSIRV
ncbi:MAG: relaxase domain-containing protein [Verrucomicrobia subdivision 3 bacterium]|nr:relaxase domain-containing protein [Limisphaerales bacterium]